MQSVTYFEEYIIILSTNLGADLGLLSFNIGPNITSYNITDNLLAEYTKYFTVVQAYNYAGLHTTESSDGVLVDLHPPDLGVVNDGKGFDFIWLLF